MGTGPISPGFWVGGCCRLRVGFFRGGFLAGSDRFLLLLVTGSWDPDVPRATPPLRQVRGFDPQRCSPHGVRRGAERQRRPPGCVRVRPSRRALRCKLLPETLEPGIKSPLAACGGILGYPACVSGCCSPGEALCSFFFLFSALAVPLLAVQKALEGGHDALSAHSPTLCKPWDLNFN